MDTFLRLRRKFNFHKVKLTYRSLGRMALGIFGFFVIISFVWIKFFPSDSVERYTFQSMKDYKSVETELVSKLKKDPANEELWRILVSLRVRAKDMPDKIDIEKFNVIVPENAVVGTQEFVLSDEQFEDFLKTAKAPKPIRLQTRYQIYKDKNLKNIKYHNKSLDELKEIALILFEERILNKAIEAYYLVLESEPDNVAAKEKIFMCLLITGQTDEVNRLLLDPKWRPYANDHIVYKYYLENHQYHKMLFYLTRSQFKNYNWKTYLTCIVAGLGWMLFLVHLGSGWFWKRKEKILIPAAVTLGFFSAFFCLGVVVTQDFYLEHNGMKPGNIIYNLAYCVLGIGLREELCKMLFFLPLLFFMKNIREDYKILCYCSLVGLGFSIAENFNYFLGHSNAAMERFLTANFAHTFLTGFICFYLVKAIQQKGKAWDEFTMTFLKMVAIHGVYDFFLMDPTMLDKGFDFFAMMLYIYVAIMYIRLLMNTAPPTHQYVSLTRVFSIAICVAVGITFLMMSSEMGIKPTLKAIFRGLISNAIFAYMFFREINEPIG